MSFPGIIIFLVLLLWFVICLPLLELYYLESKLEGKLDKIYDIIHGFYIYRCICCCSCLLRIKL